MTGSVHLVCDQGSPILWRCRFFLIFKGKIIFHTPYFAFSSILWWTLWSLPPFAYCELTLLWTLVYKHLSRLLSISLEVELLDHMVTLCLIFLKNFYAIFHSGCTVQHPRFECIRASVSLHLCELFFFFFFAVLIVAILMGVKWYLVVLICIFLVVMLNIFSCASWPFVCVFSPALAMPCGLWNLCSLTWDPTWAPAVSALSSNHWTARKFLTICISLEKCLLKLFVCFFNWVVWIFCVCVAKL